MPADRSLLSRTFLFLFLIALSFYLAGMAEAARLPLKIFLTGLMGSGKSYWGRQLAAHFRRPFLDLDKGIEMAERKSIADIFALHGEAYFRQAERNTLLSLMHYPKFVMSCGGGTPCFFDNMNAMKQAGVVIWLNPPLATLAQRLLPGHLKRPLIKSARSEEDIVAILSKLNQQRKTFYEMSDYMLNVVNPDIETFENLLRHA